MNRTTRTRNTTRPVQRALGDLLAPARADVLGGDLGLRVHADGLGDGVADLDRVVVGQLLGLDPDRVATRGVHDRRGRAVESGVGDGRADLVGVLLGGLAARDADGVLDAALELDAEVESLEVEAGRRPAPR